MRQVPHMNELFEKHEGKGLRMLTIYGQVHPLSQIKKMVDKREMKYPIALDGHWDGPYVASSLPNVWIIGADGKIKFIGGKDWDTVLTAELAKVKYPGLGKTKVDPALTAAAEAYGKGNYGEAYKLAEKVSFGDDVSEAAENDAEYIIERVEENLKRLTRHAATLELEKRYRAALKTLAYIAEHYKGMDSATESAKKLKELNASDEVKKEIKARDDLMTVVYDLQVYYGNNVDDPEDASQIAKFRKECIKQYREFAKANKGTGAADIATEYADGHQEILDAESKEKDG